MLSKSDLNQLTLEQKRQIVGALLESTFRKTRILPLSYAQEQLWFMDKLQPGSPVYNIPLYIPFESLDRPSLQGALEKLTYRHDMLRAHFDLVDEKPMQIIEPEVEVNLRFEDLSRMSAPERDGALGELLNEEVQKPFDLSGGVCVRYKLFRLDAHGRHLLSVTMHHIITDAWSLGIMVSELRRVYDGIRSGGRSLPLAPLQVEYSDYARWQREHLRGIRLSKLMGYWVDQLRGAPQILRLPTDRPRPKDQTFNGTVAGFVFDVEVSEALVSFSQHRKTTLFMLLLACYYALLYRYTGQEDLIVGAPVANRAHPELESVIGIFVNTLILRVRLQEDETFEDLLSKVQAMALDAFEHQALPFERLVDELNVERVPGYSPLYQVVFNFQNASLIESERPRAEGEVMNDGDFPFVHSNTAKVDLNLTVTQSESKVSGGIEYNTDLFEPGTIDEMISHYKAIVERVLTEPSIQLLEIPLGIEEEAGQPEDEEMFSFELGG